MSENNCLFFSKDLSYILYEHAISDLNAFKKHIVWFNL